MAGGGDVSSVRVPCVEARSFAFFFPPRSDCLAGACPSGFSRSLVGVVLAHAHQRLGAGKLCSYTVIRTSTHTGGFFLYFLGLPCVGFGRRGGRQGMRGWDAGGGRANTMTYLPGAG